MWTVRRSAAVCCDTGLKIISTAIRVVEPCTDVSTRGRTNKAQLYLLWFHNSLSDTLCVSFFAGGGRLPHIGQPSIHRRHYIFISSIISQYHSPHLNSTDYTLFPNDHSWGFANSKAIWLIRAFSLAIHNRPHVPPSACRAYTCARRLLPGWSVACVCVCVSLMERKLLGFFLNYLQCVFVSCV